MTGASSGIGRAYAVELGRRGWSLALVARRSERLEELAGELEQAGTSAEVHIADLANEADVDAVASAIAADPQTGFLVNAAGTARLGSFETLDPTEESARVRVHVLAPLRLTHAALEPMLARGAGTIVHVASRSGLVPHAELAGYSGAKAFQVGFAEALDRSFAERGIRVQALCPGLTRTELLELSGIDPKTVDPRSILEPEQVVAASLDALERGGVVCVPGEGWREGLVRAVLPRSLMRKVGGVFRRLS